MDSPDMQNNQTSARHAYKGMSKLQYRVFMWSSLLFYALMAWVAVYEMSVGGFTPLLGSIMFFMFTVLAIWSGAYLYDHTLATEVSSIMGKAAEKLVTPILLIAGVFAALLLIWLGMSWLLSLSVTTLIVLIILILLLKS